ncbi:MAG TPA: HD domain-containing phosphohydrolase [Thermoanaerobaculia bacterium]|jgi:putative nucleotidyltransferase with HDIG domain|nr:HD domain-containing phosphohydrolase [Thermoanaerobaculia bacterium]
MQTRRSLLRRLKLRTVLVVALLLSGIIPLAISSGLLIRQSHRVLRNTERDNLTDEANSLSLEINSYLVAVRRQLAQLGSGILAAPGPPEPAARLLQSWVEEQLQSFRQGNPDVRALRVLDPEGAGLGPELSPAVGAAMDEAFEEARTRKEPAYRLVAVGPGHDPQAILAVPVLVGPRRLGLVVQAQLFLPPLEKMSRDISRQGVGVFLINRQGKILWPKGGGTGATKAMLDPGILRSFTNRPATFTTEYEVRTPEGVRQVFAQVSNIQESGWGLVVQKPLSEAFADVNRMFFNAALSTVLLVILSLFFSYLAARWVSRPIQRLAETTHEIAAGKFGGNVEMKGLTFELADLAEDFNRMSGHVAGYVQQLRQAASANRELFIGLLRALVAAVDAKDPYTRGHSERVAAYSRTISRYLQLPEEVQHKIWIGALLHDVGKIGVEDRILRKDGVLAPEEYEQMKMHTVIGAEIMSPIEQLKEMIPAIRWHHESWNGRGYPDGLKGEQIPLFARIVAVADTFDAITTNRPYQQAYSLKFAVETITRLTGGRFDAKVVTAFLRAFEAGEIRAGAARPSRLEGTLVEARAAAGQR